VKDYYWVSLNDTTMEAKQYVDGGETIRRWSASHTWDRPEVREPSGIGSGNRPFRLTSSRTYGPI